MRAGLELTVPRRSEAEPRCRWLRFLSDHVTASTEDSRMQNIVSLQPDRPRPQRALGVPRSGARILFFTGVRYCRDEDEASTSTGDAYRVVSRSSVSDRPLDAAAH